MLSEMSNPEYEIEKLHAALGKSVTAFSHLDFYLSFSLARLHGLDPKQTCSLLHGMSTRVKLNKLKLLIKTLKPALKPTLPVISKYDDYTSFRDKMIHWLYVVNSDGSVHITDPLRNSQDIFAAGKISITYRDIEPIAGWVGRSVFEFFSHDPRYDALSDPLSDETKSALCQAVLSAPRIPVC